MDIISHAPSYESKFDRDSVQKFITNVQIDQTRPQLIYSTATADPQIKYVRRIKDNDLWSQRQAGRYHNRIISQYSQDYDKKCNLHFGPQGSREYHNLKKAEYEADNFLKRLEASELQSIHKHNME